MNTPCKKCTNDTGRSPGCHGKCDKYNEYRLFLNKKNELIRATRADIYEPISIRKTKKMRMKGAKHGEV